MLKQEKIDFLYSFVNKKMHMGYLFMYICENGLWKYDLEESDLMNCFLRTWKEECIIAKITFNEYACAPPDSEIEAIKSITFGIYKKEDSVESEELNLDDYEIGSS